MSGPSPAFQFAFVCCSIAATSLLAWDHIITLHAEISKMWPKKLSAPTVLYFLLRYGTLLEKVAVMLLASWYMTPHSCNVAVRFQIFPMVLRTFAFNMFSAIRVYALMGNKFPLAIFVLLLCLPSLITPAYVYAHDWSPGVNVYGCQLNYLASPTVHDRIRISGILADLLAEIIVIAVTVRKTLHIRNNLPTDGTSKLPSVSGLLLRDGTLYFVALLLLSIGDMLVLIFDHVPEAVVGYTYWVVPYYTPVFRTIVICRFLLTLRSIYQGDDEDDYEKSQIGTLRFGSRVVGNMGASIDASPIRFADGSSGNDDDYDDDEIMFARDPLAAGLLESAVASGSGTKNGDENDQDYVTGSSINSGEVSTEESLPGGSRA
ncbi:hypothetical protein HYPSUDRAFT_48303 [Hypholoma sublateritium FD-334 SS-4]|uniref:DUF6533 domain-containing protein n=1 Tax=Hypholoma sublateritium (strain FD-334 SS-4) TaxID=945553 RepID=A0A0D2N8U5_HYPSF|nr:hypothetical protein HYPSUDRAFT_48303 [Hypholoma sublateritium FD-334 SS-4]